MTTPAPETYPPFKSLPRSLKERAVLTTLSGVPALVSSPEPDAFPTPAPVVVWMHGRTAFKEIDNGRFLRLIRAGIACVSLDLPGHGQRGEPGRDRHEHTPAVLDEMTGELPGVLDAIRAEHPGIDLDRSIIGGMSAGGMVAARFCANDHPFRGLVMESSTGWPEKLWTMDIEDADGPRGPHSKPIDHDRTLVHRIDARHHLLEHPETWRTIPVLALHSEIDRTVPVACQRGFLDTIRSVYKSRGADASQVVLRTWPETGAPYEHAGFGKVAGEAKSVFLEFCERVLAG